jgi:hypothetical protein
MFVFLDIYAGIPGDQRFAPIPPDRLPASRQYLVSVTQLGDPEDILNRDRLDNKDLIQADAPVCWARAAHPVSHNQLFHKS